MNNLESIYEMTGTPDKREFLEKLTDEEKLEVIKQLTDSQNFVEILEYIKYAQDDAEWCRSYR